MGVFYDNLTSTIHSVSEDKMYRVYDIQLQITLAEIQPSEFMLTGIVGDEEERRVFISDKGGNAHIFSMG
jgi:WD40 repeat protein